ncbi:MAG: hypothetical protein Q8Q33_06090, partial [Chlamydiota bacterium]|nr:hypothetical protein [Chlamydiota bacterium]
MRLQDKSGLHGLYRVHISWDDSLGLLSWLDNEKGQVIAYDMQNAVKYDPNETGHILGVSLGKGPHIDDVLEPHKSGAIDEAKRTKRMANDLMKGWTQFGIEAGDEEILEEDLIERKASLLEEIEAFNSEDRIITSTNSGYVQLFPFPNTALFMYTGIKEAKNYQIKFIYREGLGLFIALINEDGRFLIFDPFEYMQEADEGISLPSISALRMIEKNNTYFNTYLESEEFNQIAQAWVARRKLKEIFQTYTRLRKSGFPISSKLRAQVEAFNKNGLNGILPKSRKIHFDIHDNRYFAFAKFGQEGDRYKIKLVLNDNLGLLVRTEVSDDMRLYPVDKYVEEYREGDPKKKIYIFANKLESLENDTEEDVIKRAVRFPPKEQALVREKMNGYIAEYVKNTIAGKPVRKNFNKDIKELDGIFIATNINGDGSLTIPGLAAALILRFQKDIRSGVVLKLRFDEVSQALNLMVVDEHTGAGFEYTLDNYIEAVRTGKGKGSAKKIVPKREKPPKPHAFGIPLHYSPSEKIADDALKIVREAGFQTVWDFIRAYNQDDLVSPEEMEQIVSVYQKLKSYYEDVLRNPIPDFTLSTREEKRRIHAVIDQIKVDMLRLGMFASDPNFFNQRFRLGRFGQITFLPGVQVELMFFHMQIPALVNELGLDLVGDASQKMMREKTLGSAAQFMRRYFDQEYARYKALHYLFEGKDEVFHELEVKGHLIRVPLQLRTAWANRNSESAQTIAFMHPIAHEMMVRTIYPRNVGFTVYYQLGNQKISQLAMNQIFGHAQIITAGAETGVEAMTGLESHPWFQPTEGSADQTGQIVQWTDDEGGARLEGDALKAKTVEIETEILAGQDDAFNQTAREAADFVGRYVGEKLDSLPPELAALAAQPVAEALGQLAQQAYDEGRGFIQESRFREI